MLVQVNTDRNIEGDDALARSVEATVRETLERFAEKITRVEVHLQDENSASKSGTQDIQCRLEARLAGRPPLAVSNRANTVEQAVDGAAQKLERSLESRLGRTGRR